MGNAGNSEDKKCPYVSAPLVVRWEDIRTPRNSAWRRTHQFSLELLMAQIIGSAVASEAVSRISSFISEDKISHESFEDKAERLEMAVLKIRSVVAVSEDSHITHLALLQWKAKLKRVAKEGDTILHAHKKQILECKDGRNNTMSTTITQCFFQAAKRFVPFGRKDEGLSDITVQRFERFADGADSFFKLVESGGHPNRFMFLPSLTRDLLAGKSMQFSLQRGSGSGLILLWPWLDAQVENGTVGCLVVYYENEVVWGENLKMGILFHLTEAADILGIVMSCLELLPPQFSAACLAIRGLVYETTAQRADYSNLSMKSLLCTRRMQNCHLSDCRQFIDNVHSDTGFLLPEPVLRFSTYCYVSPLVDRSCSRSNCGYPLELVCHVSPYIQPEKISNEYEQVELSVMGELLPKVTDGFYHEERRASDYKKQIWCAQNSTYVSVTPEISLPMTTSQAYLMASSGAPSTSRRTARTNSKNRPRTQRLQ